jgi:hypothetical protein
LGLRTPVFISRNFHRTEGVLLFTELHIFTCIYSLRVYKGTSTMQRIVYSINTLFQQLGLEHEDQAIERFIREHSPLPASTTLEEATFWSPSQSAFLKEALDADSEWSDVVDTLDTQLRN